MASNLVSITRRGFGETMRKDTWWLQSALTFLGFAGFIVYSTWAAFQGEHYAFGPYLSPMYSPLIWEAAGQPLSGHAWLGAWPSWLPSSILIQPITPAVLILWAPGGFRFTCYYYRGAYYKAFWADPVACAVGEPRSGYRGENWFPLILQNLHRYFLYVALLFILILAYDAILATQFKDGFGIGVGTLVLTINVILLGSYTLGCHSLRHLVGGGCDVMSDKPVRKKTYDCVSGLNRRHMLFAWMSLFWVGFSDFYVRMCSMGYWTDYRFF
ncbi:MAG: succinate dehydrogenase [Pyrinomonadaceae bacterium]